MANTVNIILCTILLIVVTLGMPGMIGDFDAAKNWFELFKALFWLALSAGSFWVLVYHLVTKKPLWRMWE